MQIDWWTLGLQAINFLILVWLLSRFLYRPVRNVIAERKAEAEHALSDAKAKAAEAEAARARYEADRAELAQRRRDLEAQVHREAQVEAGRVAETARAQAADIVETARQAARQEQSRTLEAAKRDIAAMAVTLATDMLGQSGNRASATDAIAAVEHFIEDLPDDRREDLRRKAAASDEPVQVRTAEHLSEAGRSAWADAVRSWFGEGVQAAFVADPDLLGGALLRLPHAELDVTWARQLREAEAHILGGRDEPRG